MSLNRAKNIYAREHQLYCLLYYVWYGSSLSEYDLYIGNHAPKYDEPPGRVQFGKISKHHE